MRCICALITTGLLVVSAPAIAKVYKCKDPNGAITYSQTPCEKGSSQKTLTTPASTRANVSAGTCQLVGEVAGRFHTDMRAGRSAQDLIARHGGVAAIKPGTMNLINYVSGFRYNDGVNSRRLAQLAEKKCSNGGFGNISAADLPLDPEQQMRQEMVQVREQAIAQQEFLIHQKNISVDFNNTPVSEAIAQIASKAGVNLTPRGTLTGTVSMTLDNVPWQQPLSAIILQQNLQVGGGQDGMWIGPK